MRRPDRNRALTKEIIRSYLTFSRSGLVFAGVIVGIAALLFALAEHRVAEGYVLAEAGNFRVQQNDDGPNRIFLVALLPDGGTTLVRVQMRKYKRGSPICLSARRGERTGRRTYSIAAMESCTGS